MKALTPSGDALGQKLKQTNFSKPQLAVFVLAFALIGIFIYRSFAAAPLVASLQGEQMSLPAGASLITDSTASGGKVMKLASNGTASGSVSFPSAVTSMTIIAKGTACSGSPWMKAQIDGVKVLGTSVASSWTGYSFTPSSSIAAGSHKLSVSFTNDLYKKGNCDRNLYIDVTNFFGAAPTVTPPPAVTLSATPSSVTAGQSSTLTWNSTNATSCVASGAWSGSQVSQGSKDTGALNQNSTYTLTCTGAGGSATASATISVTAVSLGSKLPPRIPDSSGTSHIYVAPNGNDSNSGTINSPVQSLAKAFSLAASGSFIEVRGDAGMFTAPYQLVNSHCSFSASNPVTVRTYPGDIQAVFASTDTTHNNVYLGNCSNIRIQHLTFASPYSVTGIKIDSGVNIELSNNLIGPSGASNYHGSMGLLVSSMANGPGTSTITTNLQILNNTVFNWYGDATLPNNNHGMYLSEGDKILVANNIIYNTVGGAGYGIQLGGETNDSWIVNNTIDNVTSNKATSYNGGGIVVWGSTSEKTQTPTNNNIIINNLLTNEQVYAIGSAGSTPGTLNMVKNNLAYHNGASDYQPFYGTSQMFTCGGTNSTTCPGSNLPNADPMYINRLAFNFHLQSGSPAIGKSDPAYTPPYDHDGSARSPMPNLGAY